MIDKDDLSVGKGEEAPPMMEVAGAKGNVGKHMVCSGNGEGVKGEES